MIVFYSAFVNTAEDRNQCTSVDHIIDHIVHVGQNYSYNIMGIGGDYNGADPFPYDAEDVSKVSLWKQVNKEKALLLKR